MSHYPEDLKYSKEHEWVRREGDEAVIGITWFAQDQLGDVVYVELPEAGREYQAGDIFGTIESVKTVSDLYMPVTCKVLEVHEDLNDEPELVNQEPYGQGWMLRVKLSDPAELDQLLTAEEYRQAVE